MTIQQMFLGGLTIPKYVSNSGVQTGSSNSLTLSVPAGTNNDDLMIAVMAAGFSGSGNFANASWTQVFDRGEIDGNGGLSIFWRIASSEPANYIFTQSNSSNYCGSIFTFRSARFDIINSTNYAKDTSPLVAPSITATYFNSVLLAAYGGDQKTTTTPTGMTTLLNKNDGSAPTFSLHMEYVNPGATGTRSSTPNSSSNMAGILFLLKPYP